MLFRKSDCDWMVVGLGNPGKQYEKSRHNIGFRVLDLLAEKCNIKVNRSKFSALTCLATYKGQKVLFVKPQTFMNLSGLAMQQAAKFYKIPPERILVIFDDISLPVGKIRVRPDGSAGGHNGIKSAIFELQSQSFPRVKVGVGAKPHPDYDLADWVLSSFSAQEEKALAPAIEHAAEAALCVLEKGTTEAMNHYNGL